MNSNRRTRRSRYCVVPKCRNATYKTPEKLFFNVPVDTKMRNKWAKAMNRLKPIGLKSHVHCCEDHFDIETDMDNYMQHKMMGGYKRLKKGVVPHKFECQRNKNEPVKAANRRSKRNKRKRNIKQLLDDTEEAEETVALLHEFECQRVEDEHDKSAEKQSKKNNRKRKVKQLVDEEEAEEQVAPLHECEYQRIEDEHDKSAEKQSKKNNRKKKVMPLLDEEETEEQVAPLHECEYQRIKDEHDKSTEKQSKKNNRKKKLHSLMMKKLKKRLLLHTKKKVRYSLEIFAKLK